jgi:hypothetical protein
MHIITVGFAEADNQTQHAICVRWQEIQFTAGRMVLYCHAATTYMEKPFSKVQNYTKTSVK